MSDPARVVGVVFFVERLRDAIPAVAVQAFRVAGGGAADVRDEVDGHVAVGERDFLRISNMHSGGEEDKG